MLIRLDDLKWIRKCVSKKIYINGQYVQSFHGDTTTIKISQTPCTLKIEFFEGLFSTECLIPNSKSQIVVDFINRAYAPIQWITIFVAMYVILDVLCFRLLPSKGLFFLLWGTLFCEIVYIFAKRKKRYSVHITSLDNQ